ncbi:Uncharacterized protein TCM_040376 [Theobroma cacao]|uniref:C2H2-type domain-containing protein n=1 Tax=Theobroma cacao TaxID=3641 RepID=A0A061GSP6_THECC|nr:Uncharacterized protein TCM_040376 [Theobroma cacao]
MDWLSPIRSHISLAESQVKVFNPQECPAFAFFAIFIPMAENFNHCNSISSVGLGLGNQTIGARLFLSPTDSNIGLNRVIRDGDLIDSNIVLGQIGLISQRVTEVKKTYVSPNRVQLVHSFVDSVPLQNRPAFPLSDVTVTEVVKTTRFLTSTYSVERIFASSPTVTDQGIFPTSGVFVQAQPAVRNQPNQGLNPLVSQNPSIYQEALNILYHDSIRGKFKRETVFNPTSAYISEQPRYNQGPSFDQMAAIFQNPNNPIKSNYNTNQERSPSYVNPAVRVPSSRVRVPSPYENQPRFHGSTFEEISNENDYDYPLGYDGRTHSLRDYPEGVYGCPKCFVAFHTSQTFAAHIQAHYRHESKEERRRRMAVKCRRKDLRLVRSRHGLTAVPAESFKGTAKGKKNGKSKIENLEEAVYQGLVLDTPGAPAMKGPLHGVIIKQEPI